MTYEKPLPDVDDLVAGPFWQALREQRVELQRCLACGYVRYPPARVCPDCLSASARWCDVGGRGTIYSYVVYERALHPAFRGAIPYTVLAITLDSGPLVMGTLVPPDAPEPEVGARVEPVFDAVTPEVTLLRFRTA